MRTLKERIFKKNKTKKSNRVLAALEAADRTANADIMRITASQPNFGMYPGFNR
ncbi:hypothetical protein HGQ17_01510 [Nesterenkonia sp. MY13]|uniref:Uncharacterized protein n=1 Tax=Nesterenkonia sedimenti TaxID=1463632 RepID=A0A7X8THZ5_9MICC|nr:hypothetical protein [Nesterenkonia sedimenti]NLS08702.1 hypothetical protein [Nesterenkonia sedimenti]